MRNYHIGAKVAVPTFAQENFWGACTASAGSLPINQGGNSF